MIDLQPFCSPANIGRRALEKPFQQGYHVYATDGRIMVRVPTWPAFVQPEYDGRFPDAQGVYESRQRPVANWIETPAFGPWEPKATRRECKVCKGSGKVGDCPDCKGRGHCPTCGQDCDECDGTGKQQGGDDKCDECGGQGYEDIEQVETVTIAGRLLNRRYVELVRALTAAQWGEDNGNALDPIPFRFDGGDGILMPMRT